MRRDLGRNECLVWMVLVVALVGAACSSGGGTDGQDAVPVATTTEAPTTTTASTPATTDAPTTTTPTPTTTASTPATTEAPAATTPTIEDAAPSTTTAPVSQTTATAPVAATTTTTVPVAATTTTTAAPATTTTSTTTSTTTTTVPTEPPGTTVECWDAVGYRYCVAAGAPVAPAGIDAWGTIVGYTPEVFCTTDMDDLVCERVTETLLVGIEEWGNYGPLEYWVLGADEADSMTLIGVNCDRRAARGQLGWDVHTSSDCVDGETRGDYGMLTYQRTSADAVVTGGGLDAGRNGNRDWGIHYFTSSLLLGLSDFSMISGRDDQKVILHEYFHAVQHAQFKATDRDLRDELLGPTWFVEGGAEFMASAATERLGASGALPEVNVEGRYPYVFDDQMRSKVVEGLKNRETQCPNLKIGSMNRDICYGTGYDLGAWAHAWLANRFGADHLMDAMFPLIEDLGWEGAFANAYGISSLTFYDEFEDFLAWPIADQMAILP